MNSCHKNRDISFENKDMSEVKHGEVIHDERINIKAGFLIPFENGSTSLALKKLLFFESNGLIFSSEGRCFQKTS